jgi:hypothetical protein
LKLHHHWQQTFGHAQNDRSIRHDFPNARLVPHRSAPIDLTALSECTLYSAICSYFYS